MKNIFVKENGFVFLGLYEKIYPRYFIIGESHFVASLIIGEQINRKFVASV